MTTAILSSMKTAGPAWALVSTVIGGYQDATTGWKKEMMRFLKLWGRIMQTTRVLWWLIQLWAKAGHWSQAALSAKRQWEGRTGQDGRAVLCLTFQLKWRLWGWMFRGTCANSWPRCAATVVLINYGRFHSGLSLTWQLEKLSLTREPWRQAKLWRLQKVAWLAGVGGKKVFLNIAMFYLNTLYWHCHGGEDHHWGQVCEKV